jgi:hypothetical protein
LPADSIDFNVGNPLGTVGKRLVLGLLADGFPGNMLYS